MCHPRAAAAAADTAASLQWEIWTMYNAIRKFGIKPMDDKAAIQGHPKCAPVTDIRPPPGDSPYQYWIFITSFVIPCYHLIIIMLCSLLVVFCH
jgi:hypothetical protein